MDRSVLNQGWFGRNGRLYGTFEQPVGGPRAVAVLFPPLGAEALFAHRAFRIMSSLLVADGVAVLRMDWTGTGDSLGDLDTDNLVECWHEDVDDCVAAVDKLGLPLLVVGLRAGATLMSNCAAIERADVALLWDPCGTGRNFLREQQMLFTTVSDAWLAAEPHPPDDLVQTPQIAYPGQLATTVKALKLDPTHFQQVNHIVLGLRSDRVYGKAVAECEALPQSEVVDLNLSREDRSVHPDDQFSAVPIGDIKRLLRQALATLSPYEPVNQPGVPLNADLVTAQWRETAHEFGRVGAFGLATEPIGGSDTWVMIYNSGRIPHHGLGRSAVDWARALAVEGYSVFRVDDPDIGDGRRVRNPNGPWFYIPRNVRAANEAVAFAREHGARRLALIGLCLGSWCSMRVARKQPVDAVYMLNPVQWTVRPMPFAQGGRMVYWRLQAAQFTIRIRGRLGRLGLLADPARLLNSMKTNHTTIAVGKTEKETVDAASRGGRFPSEPVRGLRLKEMPSLDHSAATWQLRTYLAERLPRWIREDMPLG
ncbi:MAG: hypothetical protein ACOYD0_04440 [Candidatus Nanopelagicales bacterium]